MASIQPNILWSSQSTDADQMFYSADFGTDCNDCAPPDSAFSLSTPLFSFNQPLRCANVHLQDLSQDHTLMFNPLHHNGVAVLNTPARQVWEEFQVPRSLQSLAQDCQNGSLLLVPKMVNAGLLEPVGTTVQLCQGTPQTLTAWLHVTNECNLRCDYCYIRKSDEVMRQEVGYAAVDAVIRSATKGGFERVKLKFAGGETTLNLKLVFALHTYALNETTQAGLELDTVILSNGVAIGERDIAEFEARRMHIMISLDGLGRMHDAQRKFVNGKGSFAWVSRTLDRLVARGLKPFISITISDRNSDGLPDIVDYVLDRDLPFNMNFFRDNECATPFADLKLRDERIIQAMRRAFAVIEAKLPTHSLLSSLVDRSRFDRPHNKTCGVGDSYFTIDQHGRVAKCHMEIETPIANVYADDPLTLIRADKTGVQNLSVEEKEGCRECEWRYWCTGGCPLLTFRATGRYDVKSPYCHIYKAIYPELLRLEGLRLLKLSGVIAV